MIALHGWIILDKPVGLGSTQAVSAVKRALRTGGYAKLKVGHGGTLDPLASGVLPIALGEATKLAGRMLDASKVYDFTVQFGVETDTLDAEGKAVATSDVRPSGSAIDEVLRRFTGPIDQVPPVFSALKVGGARAYDLARAGADVTLARRRVTVFSLTMPPLQGEVDHAQHGGGVLPGQSSGDTPPPASAVPLPLQGRIGEVTVTAHVSKGTYIRALARDIARALGTVGHVTMLRRTRAGPFGLDQAISLDKLAELGHARALEDNLLPLRAGLDDIPALLLDPDQAGLLRQGRVLIGIATNDGLKLAMLGDCPVALVEVQGQTVRVVRGFNI